MTYELEEKRLCPSVPSKGDSGCNVPQRVRERNSAGFAALRGWGVAVGDMEGDVSPFSSLLSMRLPSPKKQDSVWFC